MTLPAINQNVTAPVDTTPTHTSSHVSKSDSSSTSLSKIFGGKVKTLFSKIHLQKTRTIKSSQQQTTAVRGSSKSQVSNSRQVSNEGQESNSGQISKQQINDLKQGLEDNLKHMAYWQKRVDNLKQKKNKNSFDQSHIAHLTNLINQKKDIMENAKTALRNAGENAWVDKFEIDSSPEKERLELEQELEELMNQ